MGLKDRRRTSPRAWPCALLAVLFAACTGGGGGTQGDTETNSGSETGSERYVEGEPCIDPGSVCDGPGVLWQCVERSWTRIDCEEVCAPLGGLLGCLTLKQSNALCRCRASPAADACAPLGNKECISADEIALCEMQPGGELAWTQQTCENWCLSLDPPLLSGGCVGDACQCTWEGTECDEKVDVSSCWLDQEVVRCSDGMWVIDKCGVLCGPDSVCDPFAEGGAACDCQ